MQRAIGLAAQGQGHVEPNPMVGCVIAHGDRIVGEGWHRRFGGPHAEIEALQCAGASAKGATMYVTLEPCCHHGKTPPCTDAMISAGIGRVIAAVRDPYPQVAGKGIKALQRQGICVDVGLMADEAQHLNAPYWTLVRHSRPWVIAKWAMSVDGKIATRTGDSQWITNDESRAAAHRLRGRVDAVLVGRRTVERDDPLLTARPPGARTALRIVLDRRASLDSNVQVVRTAGESPVLVVTSRDAPVKKQRLLEKAGCEILQVTGETWSERLECLLNVLGKRRLTNLLVEGGGTTLGGFWDAGLVDEVHVFMAPRVLGGSSAPGPVGGTGAGMLGESLSLKDPCLEALGDNWHIWGRVTRPVHRRTGRSRRRPASR